MVNNGSWIFISHSSKDIEKVRIIRNEFEKYGQNPLAFYLKCLNTDTNQNKEELFDLIKREIKVRDWFVYCESANAEASQYVKMEREYVKECDKEFIWLINLDQSMDEIKAKIKEICQDLQVYCIYSRYDYKLANEIMEAIKKEDYSVWDTEKVITNDSWVECVNKSIEKISKKGFVLFICTENSIKSKPCIEELKLSKENNAKIIVFNFMTEIPAIINELVERKNIYYIPNIPKAEDMYLLVNLIKASLKRKIIGAIDIKADVLNVENILQEKLNYENNYHSEEAVQVGTLGSADDFMEVYRFPCCGKNVIVGDGPISKHRIDGCKKH